MAQTPHRHTLLLAVLAGIVIAAALCGCAAPTWQDRAHTWLQVQGTATAATYALIEAQATVEPDTVPADQLKAARELYAYYVSLHAQAELAVASDDQPLYNQIRVQMLLSTAQLLRIKAAVCPVLNPRPDSATAAAPPFPNDA